MDRKDCLVMWKQLRRTMPLFFIPSFTSSALLHSSQEPVQHKSLKKITLQSKKVHKCRNSCAEIRSSNGPQKKQIKVFCTSWPNKRHKEDSGYLHVTKHFIIISFPHFAKGCWSRFSTEARESQIIITKTCSRSSFSFIVTAEDILDFAGSCFKGTHHMETRSKNRLLL